MPVNASTSPWGSGTLPFSGVTNSPNLGLAQLTQFFPLPFVTGSLTSQAICYVPPGSYISAFDVDVLTAYNSASSATFSAGITSGGTDYVSGVSVKATGRIAPTYTATQLANMSNQTVLGAVNLTPTQIYLTITSVGQPTAGYAQICIKYVQLSTGS